MAEITLGQYYPENSIIHKLDPRVKLFGTLIFIIAIFSTNNIIGLLAIVMLSLIGLTVFELLFEARARYLYTYAPLYILLASAGTQKICERIDNK